MQSKPRDLSPTPEANMNVEEEMALASMRAPKHIQTQLMKLLEVQVLKTGPDCNIKTLISVGFNSWNKCQHEF